MENQLHHIATSNIKKDMTAPSTAKLRIMLIFLGIIMMQRARSSLDSAF